MPKIKTVTVHNYLNEKVHSDIERLGADIEQASNDLENSGYEIISIVPVNQGHWATKGHGAYGYTTTQGVVITGRLID